MLHLASYDIVFQEVPGEVTLALNLSGCPNRCKGCHSPHLWERVGEPLDDELFEGLLRTYGNSVTCICFMGGDAEPGEVERLAVEVKEKTNGRLKTAWYSGKSTLPETVIPGHFNYIKTGPYLPERGGLNSPDTNQRFYRIEDGLPVDATHLFLKKTGRNSGMQ